MAAGQPPKVGRFEAPPAAAPPAASAAPPAAQRAPAPQEELAPPAPAIDVAARYHEIGTIRLFALVFMFIAASTSILDSFVSTGGITAISAVGIGLTAGAVVCGFMAIINQKNRKLNNITTLLSVGLMIAGVAARPAILSLGELSFSYNEFWLAFVFALFFLLFLEYMHAVRRFWEIGEMAIEKNLREFDFSHVLKQYITMGFVWLIVAVVISLGIVGVQAAMAAFLPPQFGHSAELMSVYGLAIAEGVVFTLLALAMSFVLGRKEYARSLRTAAVREPSRVEGPISAQVYDIGKGQTPTGLSATAPPPRAQ